MIYCIIKGKKASVQYTHPNNQGIVTVFVYRGKGNVCPLSFSLKEYKDIKHFLKKEYSAEFSGVYQHRTNTYLVPKQHFIKELL